MTLLQRAALLSILGAFLGARPALSVQFTPIPLPTRPPATPTPHPPPPTAVQTPSPTPQNTPIPAPTAVPTATPTVPATPVPGTPTASPTASPALPPPTATPPAGAGPWVSLGNGFQTTTITTRNYPSGSWTRVTFTLPDGGSNTITMPTLDVNRVLTSHPSGTTVKLELLAHDGALLVTMSGQPIP